MTLLSSLKVGKATKIKIFSFAGPHMRTFHITWFAFFLCFVAWFGVAPLMPVIREEFHLTKAQIGNIIISSVGITIFARLFIGWLCDKIGPRITYSIILILGSLPVMFIGLSNSYESFLLFRLAIGVIGASFVVTQFHTSLMFAPNVVGTANATTAGWGNMGGGATQIIMPLIFAGFISLGYVDTAAWRYAMVVPGVLLFLMGIAYYKFTQDTPEGNMADLKKNDPAYRMKAAESKGAFWKACKDIRVWMLFLIYGACFGIEITIDNIAAIYYFDKFKLNLETAGLIAGLFGMMNIFARTLGGYFGDKAGIRYGLKGRVIFLAFALFMEGVALILFSQMTVLPIAIAAMLFFSLFVKMSEGATFSVVPFINKKAIGSVSGIVGAGGNVGAVLAGFLLKDESLTYSDALFIIGCVVTVVSFASFLVRFTKAHEAEAQQEMNESLCNVSAGSETSVPALV
ncbi:NarK family nitrate/nitrite MFS transporter [Adhaeribacter pallidiroseus]|uniref:Nitrate/nitrite transporter n=1 Tax=Adhaeribacter pallidiroseus TaxID=2072847 RepID=A0A369QGS7_9BACT|nr:NarK family nitrate/nitrite MFS transporter [Adhaeribacter pallidiroseus]RDC61488.1 High-affinity nitrate transporter [Adhaeribacter pallidiroseus]